jgi:3-phosphoshikimate 1-carboxyvinyltransferase
MIETEHSHTVGRAAVDARVPGDKSITHRALLLAALASGRSRLRGLLASEDTRSTAAALRALGVALPELSDDGSEVCVDGVGLRGLRGDGVALDCGNSGTTARLLTGILAASGVRARLEGDASLRLRPMDRVVEPLRAMGAALSAEGGATLPLTIEPAPLRELDYASPVASAQVKSALLLAGLVAGVRVRVCEPRLSRDHTERMLRSMGAPVVLAGGREPPCAELRPVAALKPLDLDVPGDASSAAYLAALGALVPGARLRVAGVGLNPTRTAFFDVLRAMGARVELRRDAAAAAGEPVGDVRVVGSALRGVSVDHARVPALIDELPLIAVLGAFAEGETRVVGAAELRVKESDRIAATVAGLRAVGARAEELEDGFLVTGTPGPLRGRIETHGDHRLAMAFGVLGAAGGNAGEVDGRACVDVSYPGFWAALERLRAVWGDP